MSAFNFISIVEGKLPTGEKIHILTDKAIQHPSKMLNIPLLVQQNVAYTYFSSSIVVANVPDTEMEDQKVLPKTREALLLNDACHWKWLGHVRLMLYGLNSTPQTVQTLSKKAACLCWEVEGPIKNDTDINEQYQNGQPTTVNHIQGINLSIEDISKEGQGVVAQAATKVEDKDDGYLSLHLLRTSVDKTLLLKVAFQLSIMQCANYISQ